MIIVIGVSFLGLMVAAVLVHRSGVSRVGLSRRRVRAALLTLGLCSLPLVLTACNIHVGNGH